MFGNLRAAVRKQQVLRCALIETLQKRNRARADFVLSSWRRLALLKQHSRIDLQRRVYAFTLKRTLKKFRLNQLLHIEQRRIEQLCDQQYRTHLKQLVWRTLLDRHTSPKVLNTRKALEYRHRRLLAPPFTAMKHLLALSRSSK